MSEFQRKCRTWEKIQKFVTFSEYKKFQEYINRQIKNREAIKVEVDPKYMPGMLAGGEWYQCVECKEVWRLLEPDYTFMGRWEQVNLEAVNPPYNKPIPKAQ